MSAAPRSPLEAARELAPLIAERADEIDAARELPRDLFTALADAGMFHLAMPRSIGGAELDFPTYVQVIEEIGKADASTAWAMNQGATFATISRAHAAGSRARDLDRHAAQRRVEQPRRHCTGDRGPQAAIA